MKSGAVLFAILLLAGCDIGRDASNSVQAGLAPMVAPQPAQAAAAPPAVPPNIYYDLTRFEWYARGEPLMHDSIAFTPTGIPVAIPLAELEQVGNYQGVDVYRHRSASDRDSILYVPVYEGFWLRFAARPSHTAAPD